jgi:hypothetical protein
MTETETTAPTLDAPAASLLAAPVDVVTVLGGAGDHSREGS